MKKLAAFLFLATLFSFTPQEDDINTCLKKVDSSWGKACDECTYNNDIYKVYYINTCDFAIDAVISLQGSKKIWKTNYFENVQPNDTMYAFNCHGTGKILKWVRKAGDKSIILPTDAEINAAY